MNSNKLLDGKVAAITGAGRGIGIAIARELGSCGAHIAVCELDEARGRQACDELGALGIQSSLVPCDLSSVEDAESLASNVVSEAGRIDILVNNARAGQRTEFEDESLENWDMTLAVGLRASFFASRGAISAMPDDKTGAIVNVGSILSEHVSSESASYHVGKGGLDQLTRYLAVQAAARGIRVNAVSPGFIVQSQHRERFDSDGNAEYRGIAEFAHPQSMVGSESDVARAVRFLASSDAAFITGECLRVDGGTNLRDTSSVLFEFADRSQDRGER